MNRALYALILAIAIASQTRGQAVVTYTLELSHGTTANNRTAWKSTPCANQPLFDTSGASSANGLSYSGVITWDVRVSVSGTHSSGFVPSGVARAAFDLELRDSTGALVAMGKATNSTDSPGVPNSPGFFSTINDNFNPGTCHSTDGNEAAAFAVGFSAVNPPLNGRAIDDYTLGGPGMIDFQYPSSGPNANYPTGFPAGSTALPGTLVGMSVGYPLFAGSGCPADCGSGPGVQTAGVGYSSLNSDNCNIALGQGPIAEGQISLFGLFGSFTLELVPGPTQVLKGDFDCQLGTPADFAVDADATVGSSISYYIGCGAPPIRTITGRHLFYDNSCYDGSGNGCTAMQCQTLTGVTPCSDDTAIACDKTPQLPGSGLATFANYSNYSRGINGVAIDFKRGVACMDPGPLQSVTASMFTFTVGNIINPTTSAPPPSLISVAALNSNTDRVKIYWPNFGQPGCLPNHQWLKVVVKGPANGGGISGLYTDDVFYWGLAIGESNTPNTSTPKRAVVDGVDELNARSHPTGLTRIGICSSLSLYDYDKSSTIDGTDQLISRNAHTTLNAIFLFSR